MDSCLPWLSESVLFTVYSNLRWSSEVCLWIQKKDLNLTDINRFFFLLLSTNKD